MLRRRFGERRVGHSGTLDPGATGLLLVGVGSLTRALRFLTDLPKTYTGEVVLGVETSTLDADGEVVARHDMAGVRPDDVRAAVDEHLTGPIQQVPPMVSALKVGGRRLHELAREGVEVERQPRPVLVHRFDIESVEGDPLVYRIEVECSSGTYIRSLAADLGHLLGGGAHLRNLRRTAIGSFTEADAEPPEVAPLRPPAEALRDYTAPRWIRRPPAWSPTGGCSPRSPDRRRGRSSARTATCSPCTSPTVPTAGRPSPRSCW